MLKVAILGAGRIAQIHSKSAFLNTQCELKLIADPWKEGVDKSGKAITTNPEGPAKSLAA